MKTHSIDSPEVCEAPVTLKSRHKAITLGLPKSSSTTERRFPLTPEATAMLVERGIKVYIEEGAAKTIHYHDNAYAKAGALVCTDDEAFRADIVILLSPPGIAQVAKMKKGAMLLTLFALSKLDKQSVKALLERKICTISLDLIEDSKNNRPFADILEEIDGRAAIASAAALLADSIHGKGILLGGVAGIIPCEVVIIGSGIAAQAAAASASGTGALVRIFDNDVYRLRETSMRLGPWAITSALHPKVLHNALRSADIVISTSIHDEFVVHADMVAEMKKGVVIFDLSHRCGQRFPSLACIDLADAVPQLSSARACYVNAGSAVPRTVAMALSNTLITFLNGILDCEGVNNAIKLLPGIQKAVCTFIGKPVNPQIAEVAGMRHVDINLFLSLS